MRDDYHILKTRVNAPPIMIFSSEQKPFTISRLVREKRRIKEHFHALPEHD
jgi:hypothetical protein